MKVFHFSDDGGIARFVPRAVSVPSRRPPGLDWLNGPLVWAVDETRQGAYLFPRDCPRIILWATNDTTDEDRVRWLGAGGVGMLAYVESEWLDRLRQASLFRYEFSAGSFEPVPGDPWMLVSRRPEVPMRVTRFDELTEALQEAGVELTPVPSLEPLRPAWTSTLHVSGIRLRNARSWRG